MQQQSQTGPPPPQGIGRVSSAGKSMGDKRAQGQTGWAAKNGSNTLSVPVTGRGSAGVRWKNTVQYRLSTREK